MLNHEISLIIPTYKREDQVKQIIKSLKNQKQNDTKIKYKQAVRVEKQNNSKRAVKNKNKHTTQYQIHLLKH